MPGVVVKPVETRRDQRQFIDFVWRLYRNDPNWIPPLRGNLKELCGFSSHPFYKSSQGQAFLAWRDGVVVGRILAIINQVYLEQNDDPRGFFGFFESIDDPEVSGALFDAARDWMGRQNIYAMRGPTNPSMNYECGLLVDGFSMPATFMMTYNPPYYGKLIEDYGFRKARDLYAYIGHKEQLPELERRLGPIAEQAAERCNVTVRPLDKRRFMEDVRTFLEMYNQAMVQTWSFTPLPVDEIEALAGALKHLLVPELAVIAEAEGKTVGAILGLLDYNPRVKEIDGRLFPFGFLKLLLNKQGIRRMRVLSINVLPEYQRWGLGLVLMRSLVPKAMEIGVEEAEFSWILEDNDLARMGLAKGGAQIEKTYRLYDYDPPQKAG